MLEHKMSVTQFLTLTNLSLLCILYRIRSEFIFSNYKYKITKHFIQVQYAVRIMETPTTICRRSLPVEPPIRFL